jgi:hypothetical protein
MRLFSVIGFAPLATDPAVNGGSPDYGPGFAPLARP